tara:strand:+ start:155 stop:715 length:561 start_codon:yes stop_codon:yes gene_type:complete
LGIIAPARRQITQLSEVIIMAESWNDTLLKAQGMIDADEAGSISQDVKNAYQMLATVGTQQFESTGETPVNVQKAIKETLRGQNGYPWRKGGGGVLPATALSVVDSLCSEAANSFGRAFDECGEGIRAFLTPHGRSTKASYLDGSDYGAHISSVIKKNATSLYKAEVWDGTLDGLSSAIMEDDESE